MATNTLVKESISLKLSHSQLNTLRTASSGISIDFTMNKIDAEMLKALFLQIYLKLERKALENKKKHNIKLSVAEAMAFYKIFQPYLQNLLHHKLMLCFAVVNTICTQIENELL